MQLTNTLWVSAQSDEKILSSLNRLVQHERKHKARFLIYLAEVERRKLYAAAGYGSLFRFLVQRLGFSEPTALKRMQVAKLASKYPFLYQDIAKGSFSLSALSRLAPF